MRVRRAVAAASLALTLSAVLTACGDDEQDPDAAPAETPAQSSPSAQPPYAPVEAKTVPVPQAITERPTQTWRIPTPAGDDSLSPEISVVPFDDLTVVAAGGVVHVIDSAGAVTRTFKVPGSRGYGLSVQQAPGVADHFLVRAHGLRLYDTLGQEAWRIAGCSPERVAPGRALLSCDGTWKWIDLESGEELWSSSTLTLDPYQLRIFGETLYAWTSAEVTVVDLASGVERSFVPDQGMVAGVSPDLIVTRGEAPPDAEQPQVGHPQVATAYDATSGEQVWQRDASNAIGVIGRTSVLVSADGRSLEVVDETGEVTGSFEAPDGPMGWHGMLGIAGLPYVQGGPYVYSLDGKRLFGSPQVGLEVSDGYYVGHDGKFRHVVMEESGATSTWSLPFPGQWAQNCPEPRGIPRGRASEFNCQWSPDIKFTGVVATDAAIVWTTGDEVIRWE